MNHIYSLLQGYHLGTNRAIFFMQPRPHIQNAKFTFIRGLRALEGVQEFFLVVNRPKSIPRICVEVALETAHLRLRRAYRPRIIPLSDLYVGNNLDKTAEALGLDLDNYASWRALLRWNDYLPAARLKFNEAARGEVPDDFWSSIGFDFDEVVRLLQVIEMLPDIGTEEIALIFEEYEHHDDGEFFVSGQRLGACTTRPAEPPTPGGGAIGGTLATNATDAGSDVEFSSSENISAFNEDLATSIVFEGRVKGLSDSSAKTGRGSSPLSNAGELNDAISKLNATLWDSIGSNDRNPYGEVPFMESEIMLDELSQFLRILKKSGIKDKPINKIKGIDYDAQQDLQIKCNCKQATDVGFLTTDNVARDLAVSAKEARKRRKDALLAVLDELDEKTLQTDIKRIDPVRERLEARYPDDQLRKLEQSAGVIDKTTMPTRGNRKK
ncbi:MAG: hypothetical protein AAGB06_05680 [Verrucomicrobiota bacterium]